MLDDDNLLRGTAWLASGVSIVLLLLLLLLLAT
jgi:hypothetical protein